MIDDILQILIWEYTDYYSCFNCELSYCMNYTHKNKVCSGVVKLVNPEISYDVIRLCIKTTGIEMQVYDYTPDEVQSIMTVLGNSIAVWMQGTKAYHKFRKPKN